MSKPRVVNPALGFGAALLLLAAGLYLFHLGAYGLWDPDEGRYAEIAREMLASGDFIVPHLNYVPYVEKPPLLYWLTALCLRLLGQTQFAARLTPALSAIVGVLATYLFAVKAFERRRALLAGAVLATSPLYAVMAQVLITDMLLATLTTIAFFSFFLAWRDGGRWRWAFYLAMGLGMLAKGPVAAVLPLLTALIFLWQQGQLRSGIRRLRPFSGLLLTLAIAAPWFVVVALRLPDFVRFYFVGEHLRRFFQATYSHGQSILFYLPVLLLGLFPWSLMVALAARRGSSGPARAFCLTAASVVVVFFSLASAKLIPYILPAMAPLAVLIADSILSPPSGPGRPDGDATRRFGWAGLLTAIAGAVALVLAVPGLDGEYLRLARFALLALGAILILGGTLTAAMFRRGRPDLGLASLTLTVAVALVAASFGRLAVEPMRSYARLSRVVAAEAPDAALICYHRYVQALPFYCRRRVILVGPRSELGFGAAHSADAGQYFFAADDDLLRLWNRPTRTVLLIDQPDLNRLERALGNVRVLAREYGKLAVMKAAAPEHGAKPPGR